MRLHDFIDNAQDSIVAEAVTFARTLTALSEADEAMLRDHIPELLKSFAEDLRNSQSETASVAKSRGMAAAAHLYSEADGHRKQRAQAGLSIDQLLAEYRALRSSVLRLWSEESAPDKDAIRDTTRFNEAIDQAVAESVRTFAMETETRRQLFLAALGHDLRGPLCAANLTAAAITNQLAGGPPKLAGYAKVMSRSVARMSSLLDTLLDYNLVGLGRKMMLHLAPVDLKAECEEEIDILRAALPETRIEWTVSGDCTGNFDASRVREALGNLVSNAAKHGLKTEPVNVALLGSNHAVEVTVSNSVEQAISAQELEALFEPMRRGARKSSGERTHLGLGLFITQEIAKAHGGHIHAVCVAQTISFKLIAPKTEPQQLSSEPL